MVLHTLCGLDNSSETLEIVQNTMFLIRRPIQSARCTHNRETLQHFCEHLKPETPEVQNASGYPDNLVAGACGHRSSQTPGPDFT